MMISASLMCANLIDLKTDLKALEAAGADMLHFDIMDGEFVPNYSLGTDMIRIVRKYTNLPFDIHLMVNKPEDKLDYFEIQQGDYVSVHYEATQHISRTLQRIKEKCAHPIVAINPGTPVSVLKSIVHEAEGVLIMTVNPGFYGQKLIRYTIDKIYETKELLKEQCLKNHLIEVDGNVSFENAVLMKKAGADIFVAGSSSIFNEKDIELACKKFRDYLNKVV